jgi:hypothetical protein
MGYAELETCKNVADCENVIAQIANDIAAEKNDAARAILVKTKKRYTDKLWRFQNPGGLGGTVNTPRAARTVFNPNAHTVKIPECDPATRAAIVAQIDSFVAQIDPNAVKIAAMIAARADLDAQIADAQKIAKKIAKKIA